MRLYTIGFAGKSAEQFFAALTGAGVQRLVDIRRSNNTLFCGFTRARDLPFLLKRLCGIEYVHQPEFAPSVELLRHYQKRFKVKADRAAAWDELVKGFHAEIDRRPICKLFHKHVSGVERLCLLCTEVSAEHCHRGLLAEYIAAHCGDAIDIIHL